MVKKSEQNSKLPDQKGDKKIMESEPALGQQRRRSSVDIEKVVSDQIR